MLNSEVMLLVAMSAIMTILWIENDMGARLRGINIVIDDIKPLEEEVDRVEGLFKELVESISKSVRASKEKMGKNSSDENRDQ